MQLWACHLGLHFACVKSRNHANCRRLLLDLFFPAMLNALTGVLNDIHLLTGVWSYAKLVGKCMLAVSPNGSASNIGS